MPADPVPVYNWPPAQSQSLFFNQLKILQDGRKNAFSSAPWSGARSLDQGEEQRREWPGWCVAGAP